MTQAPVSRRSPRHVAAARNSYSADGGHGAQSPARSDGGGSNISGRSEEYTGCVEGPPYLPALPPCELRNQLVLLQRVHTVLTRLG